MAFPPDHSCDRGGKNAFSVIRHRLMWIVDSYIRQRSRSRAVVVVVWWCVRGVPGDVVFRRVNTRDRTPPWPAAARDRTPHYGLLQVALRSLFFAA